MKWKDEPVFELDVRIDKKFAFTPKLMKNGEWIWLESYYQKYRFESHGYYDKIVDDKVDTFGSMLHGGFFYEKECSQSKSDLVSEIDNFYRIKTIKEKLNL